MANEILIALAGLILSVLTYFGGVEHTEKHYENGQREARIDAVVKLYIASSQSGLRHGLDGLLKAGVGNLKNDKEIRTACERIVGHGNHSPLSALGGNAEKTDLHKFFQLVIERKVNLYQSGNIESLAKEVIGAA